MVQQKLVSSEKTNEKEKICRDEPELRFQEYINPWIEYKLGDVIKDFINGQTPSRNHPEYWNGEIPWVSSGELNYNRIGDTIEKITIKGKESANLKLLPKETFLIAITGLEASGTRGSCAVLGIEATTNQSCMALIPNDEILDSKFLEQWYLKVGEHYGIKYTQGTKQQSYNIDLLKQLPIKLPTEVGEQKKITDFLSKIDKKIELLEKKCNLINEHKKGFIQKLRNNEIKFQKNGEDYSNWEEIQLKDILYEHKLKSTGEEEVYSVSVHKGVVNQIEHLGRSFATDDLSKYKLVKPGDIVYTKSPTAGFELGIIKQNKNNENVLVSPLYGVFSPENIHLGNYIDAYFESSVNTRNYLRPIVQKGAKNTMNITNKVFLSRSLLLPTDFEEQKKISNYIDLINKKYKETYNLYENMKCMKKGLLQKMFV